VGGLTLGGGHGYLSRKLGLTIDNLLEVDVVLADGRFVTASAEKNADLFWAVRGGGGNFGVATSFRFRLSPVGTVYGGPMLWHLDQAAEVLRWFDQLIADAPDDLYGFFAIQNVPPAPPFPEELQAKTVCGVVWCYTGPLDRAEEVFKPIRQPRPPALDWVGPLPYPALQSLFDALYPPGLQWYWRGDFFRELSDSAIARYVEHGAQLPPMSIAWAPTTPPSATATRSTPRCTPASTRIRPTTSGSSGGARTFGRRSTPTRWAGPT
jgi:hypothetical protein